MAAIDLKEVSDNFKQTNCRNKNTLSKSEPNNHKLEENTGMMSWTRWFRELRGKSSKDDPTKSGKSKEERRVKLNRTNSALPSNFKPCSDFGDGEGGRGSKHEKKIRDSDKRRYSFNGGSSAKLSRNPRIYQLDDRRLGKRQPSSAVDKASSYVCGTTSPVTESSPACHQKAQQHAMIGGELMKRTRSSSDAKRTNPRHYKSSSSKLPSSNNYKTNLEDVGLRPVKNYDQRNHNVTSSPSTVPPVPPVRDASSLLAGRYITTVGHEKYPSWPSCDPSPCFSASKSKSWSEDEQLTNGGYCKDRAFNKSRSSQLKTVVEKCEKMNGLGMLEPSKSLDEEARSREKIYMPHEECERMFVDDDDNKPCPPDRDISLAKHPHQVVGTFHLYNHSYQDSSYMSQDGDYAECYVDEGKTLLTKDELEQYTKDFDENIIKGSHQKQPSYAQSEGYHSYVSSNDSAIITPLLDRLRREHDVIVSVEENTLADRESSASSGSSSDTLKWHGSLSDVSVASGSYRGGGSGSNSIHNSQHNIVHSARVQTPQRHHSESVLYLDTTAMPQSPQQQWLDKVQKNNQLNNQMRKLFPVNTYSVYPQQPVCIPVTTELTDTSPISPKLTVAERIIELERQQLNQSHQTQQQPSQQLPSTKYTYFDPDKKHKVSDQSLKVIQKKALLSYYERHHSSWRSEPQLSPIPSPPQPPRPRPRLPTPTSRRSSIASDYQDSFNKENVSNPKSESYNKTNDVTNGNSSELVCQNEARVNSLYNCEPLVNVEVGPVIIGDPISVDDWVPELPPKKAHLRNAFSQRRLLSPDLPPPSPPPVADDEVFISDEPLPPPPPEILTDELGLPCTAVLPNHTTTTYVAKPDLTMDTYRTNNNIQYRPMKNITNEQSNDKQAATRSHLNVKSNDTGNKFLRYSQHLYKEEVAVADCRSHKVESDVAKETFIRIGDECSQSQQKSDFLSKRSVFSNGYVERQSMRYSSTQKLKLNGKRSSTSETQGVASVEIVRATKFDAAGSMAKCESNNTKKTTLATDASKSTQFSSTVLRHSEKFPTKLDPQCPRTTYQKSQSSYRREPRDREKGVPNFEGSYKRTMSPSSPSCASLTNCYTNVTNDVENVDPKSRIRVDNQPITHNKQERRANNGNNNISTLSPPTAATSQQRYRPCEDDHHQGVEVTTQSSCTYASNSLPKNCVLNATNEAATITTTTTATAAAIFEPKQRSSRAPRTQSDPSSVKDTSTTNLLSSPSCLSLQKAGSTDSSLSGVGIPRSQSDLSNVGSTESGYSSLSLNVPSPSVSPTRLSFSSSATTTVDRDRTTCAAIQCDMTTTREDTSALREKANMNDADADDESARYPQKSEIVLRINVASQTDSDVTVMARAEPAILDSSLDESSASSFDSRDSSSSPIFRQKSQEEIDCEELSRELFSHLSTSDDLYRILAPKSSAIKSTDYLQNVFRPNVIVDYNKCSSIKHSEDTRLQEGSITNDRFSYQSNATKNKNNNDEICDTPQDVQPVPFHLLQQKKEKLITRLEHRLNVLRAEQITIMEECRTNDELGDTISQKVSKSVSAQEMAKYKLHIQEIGHITSLLLGLSGRLAKVENYLLELSDEDPYEKKNLESKRDKLVCQLEEAKALKTNIDKRSGAVSTLLLKYFNEEEMAEYEYFVHMKSKLLIEYREISEKVQAAERQLSALKDAVKQEKH